jgi:hypothetical protein
MDFRVKDETIPLKEGEIVFKSLKIVEKEFIREILNGL